MDANVMECAYFDYVELMAENGLPYVQQWVYNCFYVVLKELV